MGNFALIFAGAKESSKLAEYNLKSAIGKNLGTSTAVLEDLFSELPAVVKAFDTEEEAHQFGYKLESVGGKVSVKKLEDAKAEGIKVKLGIFDGKDTGHESTSGTSQLTSGMSLGDSDDDKPTPPAAPLSQSEVKQPEVKQPQPKQPEPQQPKTPPAQGATPPPPPPIQPHPLPDFEALKKFERKKLNIPNKFILYGAVGVFLLGGLLMFFSMGSEETSDSNGGVDQFILEQKRIKKKEKTAKKDSQKEPEVAKVPDVLKWQGSASAPLQLTAAFEVKDNALSNFSLTLSGTPAQKRTPLEIVQNVPPRIWIDKAEVTPLAEEIKITSSSESALAFEITSKARTYLKDEKEAWRILTQAKITGSIDIPNAKGTLSWSIKTPDDRPEDTQGAEQDAQRKASIFYKGEAELHFGKVDNKQ